MARVLENVGKDLLKENGVPTPEFMVAATAEEARCAAQKIGCPVVIKALVTAGKRGKAGAVKFADSPDEAGLQGDCPVPEVSATEDILHPEWWRRGS